MAVFVSLWRLNGVVFIGHMVMIELLFILLGTVILVYKKKACYYFL